MTTRKPTQRCPCCGGEPDEYTYQADSEDLAVGFPAEYRACEHCWCPLVEVGRGHERADWQEQEAGQ